MIKSIDDLIAFLRVFHWKLMKDPALSGANIPPDLPPALVQLYRELGGLTELPPFYSPGRHPFAAQDALHPVGDLRRISGMVELVWENQGNWSVRFPLGERDPPVYSDVADLWEPTRKGFLPVCSSLTHFLITFCLREAVFSCEHLEAMDSDVPLNSMFGFPVRPLWLNGQYVYAELDHHFYTSPDGTVLIMQSDTLWVGSTTRAISTELKSHEPAKVRLTVEKKHRT